MVEIFFNTGVISGKVSETKNVRLVFLIVLINFSIVVIPSILLSLLEHSLYHFSRLFQTFNMSSPNIGRVVSLFKYLIISFISLTIWITSPRFCAYCFKSSRDEGFSTTPPPQAIIYPEECVLNNDLRISASLIRKASHPSFSINSDIVVDNIDSK